MFTRTRLDVTFIGALPVLRSDVQGMLRPQGCIAEGWCRRQGASLRKQSPATPLQKSTERSAANGACATAQDRPASSQSSEKPAVCSV